MKRFLPDPTDRLRLADLVIDEAKRTRAVADANRFPIQLPSGEVTPALMGDRAREFAALTEISVAMLANIAALGDRDDHARLVTRALDVIANPSDDHTVDGPLVRLQRFPALICLHRRGRHGELGDAARGYAAAALA